jgi:hypothetical protein
MLEEACDPRRAAGMRRAIHRRRPAAEPDEPSTLPHLPNSLPDDPTLLARIGNGLDAPVSEETRQLAAYLASAFGPATHSIVHYGSHAQGSHPGPGSAHDFFIIVDEYAEAYRSLHVSAHIQATPATATTLARVLPPNVLRVIAPLDRGPMQAKCAVLTERDLQRLCSPRAWDHFTQGRLFQQVQIAWTRDPESHDAVRTILIGARLNTWWWGRPYLPPTFRAEEYFQRLLETSFAAEIRPEGPDRVEQLVDAQRAVIVPAYEAVLEHIAATGKVVREGQGYRAATEPTPTERLAIRAYFSRSKARATARWSKHIALYDDWLGYIVEKIERRTGQEIELTEREKRWPLIFLWPRAIEFVRTRPQRKTPT